VKNILVLLVTLVSAQGFAASSFECYSQYYSANKESITVNADVSNDQQINHVSVKINGEEVYNLANLTSNSAYKPRKYKGFEQFELGENPLIQYDHALKPLDLLLPANLTETTEGFVGYVSDDNADASGSNGYYEILCQYK